MESKYNRDFDGQVKKKFDDFSPEVPSFLWNKIEEDLAPKTEKPGVLDIKKGSNLKRYMSIAASLLLIGFAIWKLQPEEKIYLRKSENLVQRITPQAVDPEQEVSESSIDNTPARNTYFEEAPLTAGSTAKEVEDNVVKHKPIQTVLATEDSTLYPAVAYDIPEKEIVDVLESSIDETPSAILPIEEVAITYDEEVVLDPDPEPKGRAKVVSSILNFVAGNLQVRGNQVIEFTETQDGILKVDLKGVFAKNDK